MFSVNVRFCRLFSALALSAIPRSLERGAVSQPQLPRV